MTAALISSGDLAGRLGVAPATVRRWVQEGWLVPVLTTPGGHHRFDLDSVVEQLAQKQTGPESDSEPVNPLGSERTSP